MNRIIPSIIADNFTGIKEKIDYLEGLVPMAQVDIADGIFAPNTTWQNPEDLDEVHGRIKLEAHLMVVKPEAIIRQWFDKVDSIVIHLESTDQVEVILDLAKSIKTRIGLALKMETSLEDLYPLISDIHFVQLMAIDKLGFYGQSFVPLVIEKIKTLHHHCPDLSIQIDGGIDLNTGRQVIDAGADKLIVGTAFWQADDRQRTIKEFNQL
jgi:ribulose-phosphate 3-epimerase